MTKTIVQYARVSTEAQDGDQSVSIDQQLADMSVLVESRGWTVAGVYVDSENYQATQNPKRGRVVNPSGERADRPALLDMLESVQTGEVDAILCWRDDRLVRHPRVNVAIEDALDLADSRRNGRGRVDIYDATGAVLDRFTMSIKAAVWKEENKRRVERVRMGKMGTLKAGFWPGPYRRLGYTTQPAERGRRILLGDPDEVQTVRDIFNWYDSGVKVIEIRRRLTVDGRQQRGGYNGNGKAHDWGPMTIRNILRAEAYTGKATWEFKETGEKMTIPIPRIISDELFRRVQKRMDNGRRESTRNTKGVYLLQNLAVCGGCGGKLTVTATNQYYYIYRHGKLIKRYKRPKEKLTYRYYCSQDNNYPDEAHPKPSAFQGEELDWQVWRYIADKVITHPDLIIEQVRNRQAELIAQGDSLDGDIARVDRRLAQIKRERLAYTRQLGRGKVSEAEYDVLIAECNEAREAQEEKRAHLRQLRDEAEKVQTGIAYAERLLASFRDRLPQIDQNPAELKAMSDRQQRAILKERQAMVRALCDRVVICANGEITIDGLVDVGEKNQFFDINNPLNVV